jgi:hypothetical protein
MLKPSQPFLPLQMCSPFDTHIPGSESSAAALASATMFDRFGSSRLLSATIQFRPLRSQQQTRTGRWP